MAATIADVIESARFLLNDTVTPYRYGDDRLVKSMNFAFREAFRIRPDLFLSASFVLPEFTTGDLTPTPADFPIEDQYFNTVVNFMAGYTELSDDEFALDGKAMTLINTFANQLRGITR